jgi:drug/metabolite transporter (DMT)-like permease
MSDHLTGVGLALMASALYSIAVGLQAFEARQVSTDLSLRFSLLARLTRRPLWIAGAATGLLGWALQAIALAFAPLTLVEPTLAATLVFLLVIGARTLDERVGPRDVLGVFAVVAGVAGLGVTAPQHSAGHASGVGFLLILVGLSAVVVLPRALGGRRPSPPMIASGAGIAYAFVGLSTKFAVDDASAGAWFSLAAWVVVLGLVAAIGLLNEMSALQLRPVTQIAPIVFALNVLVPVVLAPVLAGESWSGTPAMRAALAFSLVAIAAGVIVLSRSGVVGAMLEGDGLPREASTAAESAAEAS